MGYSYYKMDRKDCIRCFYCRKVTPNRFVATDHIIPKSFLEKNKCESIIDSNYNKIQICMHCNSSKGVKTLQNFLLEKQMENPQEWSK